MIRWQPVSKSAQELIGGPALVRLERLAPKAIDHVDWFAREGRSIPRRHPARRDILPLGRALAEPMIVVDGWVCHHRLLQDGRRQIIALTLPGEVLIPDMRAAQDAIGAVTDVTVMNGPPADTAEPMAAYYALNARLQQAYLLDHVIRLGCQVAYEAVAHLLLELHERLTLSGLTDGDRYRMPLTQEALADLLGLTSVHVNRTLQTLKRDRLIDVRRGEITLVDRSALMRLADFHPADVTPTPNRAGTGSHRSDTQPRASIRQIQLL